MLPLASTLPRRAVPCILSLFTSPWRSQGCRYRALLQREPRCAFAWDARLRPCVQISGSSQPRSGLLAPEPVAVSSPSCEVLGLLTEFRLHLCNTFAPGPVFDWKHQDARGRRKTIDYVAASSICPCRAARSVDVITDHAVTLTAFPFSGAVAARRGKPRRRRGPNKGWCPRDAHCLELWKEKLV